MLYCKKYCFFCGENLNFDFLIDVTLANHCTGESVKDPSHQTFILQGICFNSDSKSDSFLKTICLGAGPL